MIDSLRLGTTSYILPADLLSNAAYLSRQVQDMELVLFDLEDGPSNLPTPQEVQAMAELAAQTGLTYTVHLPLDLHWGQGNADHPSLHKARKVIDLTRDLRPFAYVGHLEGREIRSGASDLALTAWREDSLRALERVTEWIGAPELFALENLEGYALDLVPWMAERLPINRCVDIGHLWLDGLDPLPYLKDALERTRVIHIHGIEEHDHRSLAFAPLERVAEVAQMLGQARYSGVVTFEVFGKEDFASSLAAWRAAEKIVAATF